MITIGSHLKMLRENHDPPLTREELAAHLNLKYQTISKYETDQRQPDYETLEKIADFFDVSIDFLFGRVYKDQRELLGAKESSAIYDKSKPSELHKKIDQLPEEKQKVIETITDSFLREVKPPDNDEQAAAGGGK